MSKSLVIGMGIGSLYASVLKSLGHDVVTVDSDPSKRADYRDIVPAVLMKSYDTAHICTPNFTHESLARTLTLHAPVIFVEKPGFETAERWRAFADRYPSTRIMMVKNNQWRDNFHTFRALASRSKKISIRWINKDRVPRPGSWFTTSSRAWGGVSRDLLPHLLSIFVELGSDWMKNATVTNKVFCQRWRLEDIAHSDYGEVSIDGVYDVDDRAELTLTLPSKQEIELIADWRNISTEDIGITFYLDDGTVHREPLGLCPQEAYQTMIRQAILNKDNDLFWKTQFEQDLWIHQQIQP